MKGKNTKEKNVETFYDALERYEDTLNLPEGHAIGHLKDFYEEAYRKEIDPDADLNVIIDKANRKVIIEVKLEVVEDDFKGFFEYTHIHLSDARKHDKKIKVGDVNYFPVPQDVINQHLMKSLIGKLTTFKNTIKSTKLHEKFHTKIGTIVRGKVTGYRKQHHQDDMYLVAIDECVASLPVTEIIPREQIVMGTSILCSIKEIIIEGDKFNMILSRRTEEFVAGIFEEEIEEIKNEEVEIKKIVRYPGTLSVVLVHTDEPDIKPELACIGREGSRIKSIRDWMDNEQVIVARYNPNIELQFLALFKAGQIEHVSYNGHDRIMNVWVKDYEENIGKIFGAYKCTIKAAQQICNLFDIRIFDTVNPESTVEKIVGDEHTLQKAEESRKAKPRKTIEESHDVVEEIEEQNSIETEQDPVETEQEIKAKREEKKAAEPEKLGDEVEIVTIKQKKEKKQEEDVLEKRLREQREQAQAFMGSSSDDFDEDFDDEEEDFDFDEDEEYGEE